MESCLLKFNLLFHPGGYTWDKYDDGDDDGSLALNANDVPGSFLTTSCVLVAVESLSHVWLSHARLTCPSLSPRICSNSCPLSWWCYPTVSSSVSIVAFFFFFSLVFLFFSWILWDLVPWPGIEPWAPALGAQPLGYQGSTSWLYCFWEKVLWVKLCPQRDMSKS